MVREGVELTRGTLIFFGSMTALVLLAGPTPGFAEDKKACGKQIAVKGFPHTFKSVASLSAVRAWSQTAEERDGADYAMWHNASRQELKCNFIEKSKYIMCFAKGYPCKAHRRSGKTAAKSQ